jgi:hypothetical protein
MLGTESDDRISGYYGNSDMNIGQSPQGDKVIIIVPKIYHESVKKLKNPLHVTIKEILE